MSKVAYDPRAVTIDGQRVLLLSGAIHYPRSTPGMWPALMQRSREAGLNTIETYVFWNLHERRRGILNFADRLDLAAFCRLAQEHGLHVILRIGPYICAETNYGGFPFWLRDLPGLRLRTYNEPYLREKARWVRLLTDYLRPYLAPQGGPILLAQIENEYANVAAYYGDDGKRYLDWCVELSETLALGIPWIMCSGAAQGVIETINGFYAHEQLGRHFEQHPDQPALWTEHWPGWYDTFGYPHHVRAAEDVAYAVARFFAAGGTGMNYYMWHGGTNFGRESMFLQTTSYDFDAPLDEVGLPTTKSSHLAVLHGILADHADLLLGSARPKPEPLGEKQSAYVYSDGKRELAFLCNDDKDASAVVEYRGRRQRLAAKSVVVLGSGRLLLNSANVTPSRYIHHTIEPARETFSPFESWAEPMPRKWPKAVRSHLVADRPVEQLLLTRDETDYCWYTIKFVVSRDDAGTGTLTLDAAGDVVHVFVDGGLAATTTPPLPENRGAVDGKGYRQVFQLDLAAGKHELSLLCCALGLVKGDWMLGQRNMVEERKGLWGPVRWKGEPIAGQWIIQAGLLGERCRLYAEGRGLVEWKTGHKAARSKPLRWLKATFPRPAGDAPLLLDLGSMGKGMFWLNGRLVGRYWLVSGGGTSENWLAAAVGDHHPTEPTQRYYHLPSDWLLDQNTLVLFEETGGKPSAIKLCRKT